MPGEFDLATFQKLYGLLGKNDVDQNFQGLSYISWATAWKALLSNDPDANYEIKEKPDGGIVWEEYGTFLVKTSVTAFGKTISMHLPIMDSNHNAVKLEAYELKGKGGRSQYVPALNSRILNDNIMRCLAKNIAMFGIGLALYVKEDLPDEEKLENEQGTIQRCYDCGEMIKPDGKLTAKQVIEGTTKAYGVALCASCGRKRKEMGRES